MDKRYQVFVSSTYTDLKDERKNTIEALLNARFIPAGMEMFSASNDEQFKYIKKIIDTCDYYILIVGGRYGTVNPATGLSFTEQEYDYAISKNIPVLVFLHSDPYNLPLEKRDDNNRELLEKFRKKASKNRMCKMWRKGDELISSIIISLIEETNENPQLGWTRGSVHNSTELLSQINKLRLEKDELTQEIKKLNKILEESTNMIENLACGNDQFMIKGKVWGSSGNHKFNKEISLTWDEIFSAIGPHLISSVNYSAFKRNLIAAINAAHNINFSSLNDDCVQTIKLQFDALGFINCRPSESVSGGVFEFIGLTEKGRRYLIEVKAIKNI